jgi:predicted outer membrane repeat protein
LREALTNASAGDLISFAEDIPSPIFINRPLPTIPDGVAIVGPGSNRLTIRRLAGTNFRIFHLPADRQATIQGLRITGGNEEGGFGGGIYSVGNLHLIDVDMVDNRAQEGAGLFSDGRLTMLRCSVRENEASFRGGGMAILFTGDINVRNTTFFANSAAELGGAIRILTPQNLHEFRLSNSTIVENSAGNEPGISIDGLGNSTFNLTSNLFADQSPSLHVAGFTNVVSGGFNLVSNDGNGFFDQPTDQINTDPGELVLDTDSGLTPVLRLAPDSPALDAGIATDASFFDGRGEGFRRTEELERPNAPGSDGTDIGAFELRGPFLFRSRFESD